MGIPHLIIVSFFVARSSACIPMKTPAPGIPAKPACTKCASNLIMKDPMNPADPFKKKMDDDQTVTTGKCAERTFTCKGTLASIRIYKADGSEGAVGDGGTGIVTFTVMCNADGTAWMGNGQPIVAVECSAVPACRTCDQTLITKTVSGTGELDDKTSFDTGCAVRTFTCKGTMATLTVKTSTGTITVPDRGTGSAVYAVTCNAAGTAWDAQMVTAVECSAVPACTMCAANLITVDPANPADPGSKDMDFVTPGMAGGCATRTFTCAGSDPVIEINGGASMVTDPATATVVATCNAAGTAWETNGVSVTKVACTIPCKRCDAAGVKITQSFFGMTTTTGATIDRTGACATWNLVCTGPSMQYWDINDLEAVFPDDHDGTADGFVNLLTTCDAKGEFFTTLGINIVTADCTAAS